MALAQLLKNFVLLAKSIAVSILRVVEHETCLIENGDLVCVLKLSTLIPSNNSLIDKRSVARKILYDSNSLSVFVLVEYQAMPI